MIIKPIRININKDYIIYKYVTFWKFTSLKVENMLKAS